MYFVAHRGWPLTRRDLLLSYFLPGVLGHRSFFEPTSPRRLAVSDEGFVAVGDVAAIEFIDCLAWDINVALTRLVVRN